MCVPVVIHLVEIVIFCVWVRVVIQVAETVLCGYLSSYN